MIKIPKSLNELKTMMSEVNITDALTKVQETINSASGNVQAAAAAVSTRSPLVEGELGEVIEQLQKLQAQEQVLLKRLAELTAEFQKQIGQWQQQMAAAKAVETIANSQAETVANTKTESPAETVAVADTHRVDEAATKADETEAAR